MHQYPFRTINPNASFSYPQDQVLQQFYQQRRKRVKGSNKRHSLLDKNSSYFSNTTVAADNPIVGSRKTKANQLNSQSKTNIQNTQNNQNPANPCSTPTASMQVCQTRKQIKQHSHTITQQQILNKYRNMHLPNDNPCSKNKVHLSIMPSTTKNQRYASGVGSSGTGTNTGRSGSQIQLSKSMAHASTVKNGNGKISINQLLGNVKYKEYDEIPSRKSNYDSSKSSIQSTMTKYQSNERKKNLEQYETNYKILTGQIPPVFAHSPYPYPYSYSANPSYPSTATTTAINKTAGASPIHKQQLQLYKECNIRERLKNYLEATYSKQIKEGKGNQAKIGDEGITEEVLGNGDIKIINKVRSNSNSNRKKSNTTHNEVQHSTFNEQNQQIYQQSIINNGSFCNPNPNPSPSPSSSPCAVSYTHRQKQSKYEQSDYQQPLLVLANKQIHKPIPQKAIPKYNPILKINTNININPNKQEQQQRQRQQQQQQQQEQSNQYSQFMLNAENQACFLTINHNKPDNIYNDHREDESEEEFHSPNFKMYNQLLNNTNTNQNIVKQINTNTNANISHNAQINPIKKYQYKNCKQLINSRQSSIQNQKQKQKQKQKDADQSRFKRKFQQMQKQKKQRKQNISKIIQQYDQIMNNKQNKQQKIINTIDKPNTSSAVSTNNSALTNITNITPSSSNNNPGSIINSNKKVKNPQNLKGSRASRASGKVTKPPTPKNSNLEQQSPIQQTKPCKPSKQKQQQQQHQKQQYKLKQKQKYKQLQLLKQRIGQLQKINKKQTKFIDSIQRMRKVILHAEAEEDCGLKELWRWVKALPNFQFSNQTGNLLE